MTTINITLINEICDSIVVKGTRESTAAEATVQLVVSAKGMLDQDPLNIPAIRELLIQSQQTVEVLKLDGENLLNDAQAIKNELLSPTGNEG